MEDLWYTVGRLERDWGMKFDPLRPDGLRLVGFEKIGYLTGRNAHKWA